VVAHAGAPMSCGFDLVKPRSIAAISSWPEPEVPGTHHALHLLGAACPYNCSRHRRVPQRPGDRHFARRPTVPCAEGPQAARPTPGSATASVR